MGRTTKKENNTSMKTYRIETDWIMVAVLLVVMYVFVHIYIYIVFVFFVFFDLICIVFVMN